MPRLRILALVSTLAIACTTSPPPPTSAAPVGSATSPSGTDSASAVSPGQNGGPASTDASSPGAPAPSSGQATAPAPSKSGPAGAMCGGIAGFGCAAGLYCSFPVEAHCGAADQSGVCKPIPEMCTEQFAPVCGCNDKTYPNDCFAAREGVSVGHQGECASAATLAEGQTCGTRGVPGECSSGLYCKYKRACGETDSGGTCVKRPQVCTKIYRPVCGCDGKTYGSDCVAAGQGVSVRNDGACKTTP